MTMDKINPRPSFRPASSPVSCICIGTITGILWFSNAYALSSEIRPYRVFDGNGYAQIDNGVPVIAALIGALACTVMSAMMIHGVTKKRPNLMFPWIAIHFALIVIGCSMAISVLYRVVDRSTLRDIALTFFTTIGSVGALIWVWSGVYLHYNQLKTEIPTLPTCLNEGKVLEKPNEPQNPYYSV